MYDAPNNNKNILLYYRWKSASAAQLECGCVSAIIAIAWKLFVNAARMWGLPQHVVVRTFSINVAALGVARMLRLLEICFEVHPIETCKKAIVFMQNLKTCKAWKTANKQNIFQIMLAVIAKY